MMLPEPWPHLDQLAAYTTMHAAYASINQLKLHNDDSAMAAPEVSMYLYMCDRNCIVTLENCAHTRTHKKRLQDTAADPVPTLC
jgi:hypothetical protein